MWKPRIDDFGEVWNVLAKRPLLPCIPHRRGLFWLNSPDIMEFSLWNVLQRGQFHYLLCKGSACFDRLEYWVSAICLEKLCKTAFCPRSVDKRQRFHVYLGCDVQKVQKAAFFSRHQICWQDFVRVNLSNTKFGLIIYFASLFRQSNVTYKLRVIWLPPAAIA